MSAGWAARRQAGISIMTVTLPLPFANSRPLGVRNEFFADAGVALDVISIDPGVDLVERWRQGIAAARARLGWPGEAPCVAAANDGVLVLAVAAPADQLQTAAEANQWALCAALRGRDPMHWCGLRDSLRARAAAPGQGACPHWPAELDQAAALARLERLAAREKQSAK